MADGRSLALGGRRERAVLALLLLSANRVVASEKLVDELWPDTAPREALHSLRVGVSRLRKVLHEAAGRTVIDTEAPGYVLRVAPEAFDLARFESLVARGRGEMAHHQPGQAGESLREALALWRGPALTGAGEAAFARAEAARLEEARLSALETRVEADLAAGRHTELPAELDALTRAHPLREMLWGQRMLALYRSGRQADALRAFQELRRILGEELGIEPSLPLVELEAAMLRQEPALDWMPPGPDRPMPGPPTAAGRAPEAVLPFSYRTPFVGREGERAELCRRLDGAAAGEGGVVLIAGEPGVGKSRLAEELAAEAAPAFRVLVGHCYESGRQLPYMPWVELIEAAMVDTDPDELRCALGAEAPEFARLVPELRHLLPDIPPSLELPPEQQRRYTFNSVRDYIVRASRAQPRLYFLEDLHWADEPTLLLLEHLAERLSSVPCLIVGTHRDSDSDLTPQLAKTLGNLVRHRLAHRLRLSPHSEDEVEALLRALSGQAPPEEVRAVIYQETDGNAFFVEEVFRHLAESGRLLDDRGRFRTDVSVTDLDVPANVRLVIDRRLERLDDVTYRALSIAAVAGRHLGFGLWEAIGDIEGEELIDAIDRAERAGLIVTGGAGEDDGYWFAHELIRQTLLVRLPVERRRRHHLRVADAIDRRSGDDLPAQSATIAAHLLEAGSAADPARLFRHLVLAGSRALVSAAFEDALRHLHRAEPLAHHAAPIERAEMLVSLGMAERGVGNVEQAIDAWRRAVELFEKQGDTAAIGRMCPVAAYSLIGNGRWIEAFEVCRRGLAALGDEASADRARLLAMSGPCISAAGQYDDGMDCVMSALDIAARLEDPVLAGYTQTWKSGIHHLYMESRDAVDSGLAAADVLRAAGQSWDLSVVLALVAFSSAGAGRFASARQAAAEGRPLAEQLGNHLAVMQCGRSMAMVDWAATGDIDGLEVFGRRDLQLCRDVGIPWLSWSWTWLALAAFLRGDWDTAIVHAEQGDGLAPPGAINGVEWSSHFQYRAYAGQRDRAMAMLADRRDELPRPGEPAGWGSWAMLLGVVEGLVFLDERDAAADLYPRLRWCIERTDSPVLMHPDARLLQRAAGMAAAAGSDWDAAEAHFRAALEQAETLPHRPEQAHTRRFHAAMLLRRGRSGDREHARRLATEAEALYREMGMSRHLASIQGLPS